MPLFRTTIDMTVPCEVGTIIELKKDGESVSAVTAEGAKVGFVSQTPLRGYQSSPKVVHDRWLSQKVAHTYAIVRTLGAGKTASLAGVEAYFMPKRKTTAKANNRRTYLVGGRSAENPGKAKLVGDIQRMLDEGEQEPLNIQATVSRTEFGDTTKVFVCAGDTAIPGASAGEIMNPDDDLLNALSLGDMKATVIGKGTAGANRSAYSVEIDLDGTCSVEDFYADIDNAISRCAAQNDVLEAKVGFMIQSHFEPETIKGVLGQMSPGSDGAVSPPKHKYIERNGWNLSDTVNYMLMGKTVRFVGEKGAGKNTLIHTACWLLSRPFCRVQGSSEMDKLDILGSRTLKNGNTGFELSTMLETLQNDGIVIIDEANMVPPEVLSLLHSLTDDARSIDVAGYGTVTMGPHACILYTLNEDYAGTQEMNPATIDRGPSLHIEQETDMKSLLKAAVPNASDAEIAICATVSDAIRAAVNNGGNISADAITVRGYIDALQSAKSIPLKRTLVQNVANKVQSTAERNAICEIIATSIG